MNNYSEVICLHFMSYAGISFKAEISAIELDIDWGDGECTHEQGKNNFTLSHIYQQEGLQTIKIKGKGISILDVSRLSLTELSLVHCPTLEALDCSVNELSILDIAQCPGLEELSCNSNNLRAIDFRQNVEITQINISNNLLQTLDLTQNPLVESLHCSYNHLKKIHIKANGSLRELDISSNLLDKKDLNQIFRDVPPRKRNALISYWDNPGSVFADTQILKLKKWL